MSDSIYITIAEDSPINVTVAEDSPININIDGYSFVESESFLVSAIIQEVPTSISSVLFETTQEYYSQSLKVWINGVKERASTITHPTACQFQLDTAIVVGTDSIEVEYIKQP